MIAIQKILVPTDFSDSANAALQEACRFAERFGAELHLLHVVDDVVVFAPHPFPGLPPMAVENLLADQQKAASQQLAKLPDSEWVKGLVVVRSVARGRPADVILEYAKNQSIDLIVQATHGRTGLTHLLLGSVAENVVRRASCPVLTVRPKGQGGQAAAATAPSNG